MVYRFAKAYPDALLVLPDTVLQHCDHAGEGEIRILLHLAAALRGGALEEEALFAALLPRFPREEIVAALAFWRGCGVLKGEGKKGKGSAPEEEMPEEKRPAPTSPSAPDPAKKAVGADEAPFYTAADLARAADQTPEFKNLVAFAEERLEKVLNASELARLWSFLDYLKMPFDVVMLVIEDSVSRGKKSLRYITKMLNVFQDEGITSYEKAEAYFLARREDRLYENIVRRLFGFGERKLTREEEKLIRTWRVGYGFGEEMLEAAFERTVGSAKKPSVKYMHKILENWHKDGVQSPDQIGKKAAAEEKAPKSYDLDDFFEQAVSKGRKSL